MAVAAGHNLRVGAGRVRELEQTGHLLNGGGASAIGEVVVRKGRRVLTADALYPDVATTERRLEARTDRGAERTLEILFSTALWHIYNMSGGYVITKLPLSVEPRAKMKIASGQVPPFWRSLRVLL